MKERFLVDRLLNDETGKMQAYEFKQVLTWQFYIRAVKRWFTPCNDCQKSIEVKYEAEIMGGLIPAYNFQNEIFGHFLCKSCKEKMKKEMLKDNEVIFGNIDYEPFLELSRKWIDDDDYFKEISDAEWEKRN